MADRRWSEPLVPGDVWVAISRRHRGLRARIVKVIERFASDRADKRVQFKPIGHGSKGWSQAQRNKLRTFDEVNFRTVFTPAH